VQFGYGGANAHVIMESADPWTSIPELSVAINGSDQVVDDAEDAQVLILSARDERGCQQLVEDLKAYLEKNRSLGRKASAQLLRDLSYTLGERRTLFQWMAAYQVRLDKDGTLDAAIQAFDSPRFKPRRQPTNKPRIGMVFTGQGAQWYAMGRELLTSYPVFRQSIDEAEAHLRAFGADWSLLDELERNKETTNVHHTAISIPVCVALQIALVQLLESWGITPTGVVSHSSGEISAAFAVGALTHRQAMAAAYYRAVLAADDTLRPAGLPKGAMAAVGLGSREVQSYLDKLPKNSGKAVIACVNSPQSVTIAGDDTAVDEIEEQCKQSGVFARKLKVQQAYHSHHMTPFAEAYREHLMIEMAETKGKQDAQKTLKASFSSAVTGGRVTKIGQIASPDHWVGSLVGAVEFVDAFTDMVLGDLDDPTGRSIDVILEVGPHTALGGPIREILSLPEFEGLELPYWGCLVRDEHAGDSMRTAAINLLREGYPLVMSKINLASHTFDDEGPRVLTDLPTYPWNHTKRHWQEARVNRAIRERSEPPHELLGMPVPGNDPSSSVWRRVLKVADTPWISDHMVQGTIVYPGAGSICMAIEAVRQLEKGDVSGFRLRDIKFLFALVIPDGADGVEIRTTLRPVPERDIGACGWRTFEISSVTLDNRWTLHAEGMIIVDRKAGAPETLAERRPMSIYTRHKDPQDLFANLRAGGIYHGPLFQNTTKIVQDGREARAVCDITVRHEASADTDPAAAAPKTLLHPITLDAIVVAFYTTLPSVGALQEDPKLPSSIASMWISNDISREIGSTLKCDTSLMRDDTQSGSVNITVTDGQTDATVLKIQGLGCASLGRGSGIAARQDAANKGDVMTAKWEQEVCSKLAWGPDLSLQQPLALAQIKKQLGEKSTTTGKFSTLLLKLVHKNPGAHVLQIGGAATTGSLLATLGTPKVPLVGSWHLTEPSSELLDDARTELADWGELLEFDQFDVEQSPAKQNFTPASYDIVVASQRLQHNAAGNVRSLLKAGGVLLAETTEDLSDMLQAAGFGGVDLVVCGVESSIIMSTLPLAQDLETMRKQTFAVVTSTKTPPPSKFVDQLSQRIRSTGAVAPEHLVLEESSPESFSNKTCIFVGELDESILADLNAVRMNGLRSMVTQCNGLLWITTGGTIDIQAPERALSQGFLRVLRNEYIGRRFLSLDLDPSAKNEEVVISAIAKVLEEGFGRADNDVGAVECEYAERDGVLMIPRVYKDEQYNDMIVGPLMPSWGAAAQASKDENDDNKAIAPIPLESLFQEDRPLKLEVGLPGHLDTLAFVDVGKEEVLSSELVEITPRAYGVSSRDVLAAMGQIRDRSMGLECAGIIERVGNDAQANGYSVGDRVMALLDGSSFASHARVHWHGVAKIPGDMDFEKAASLPLAFTVAYAGLIDSARLMSGQSVLVHAAAGAFGQAAIMLAKHVGVTEIYATAGSQEKRDLLIREHGIPAERIFSSRDALFAPAVLAATKGRGVDAVLSSLSGPLLQATLGTIAPLGHLIEIGKKEFEANSLVGLDAFSRGISLTSLDAPTLLRRRGPQVHAMLGEITRLIKQQALKPVSPITVHPVQDAQAAFQFVQTGAQSGKVVLSVGPEDEVHVVPRPKGFTPGHRLQCIVPRGRRCRWHRAIHRALARGSRSEELDSALAQRGRPRPCQEREH
jgi:acyl transferase domain-containing protein/NADPH:quinone reductase-like Zn-dependent oxidoreductase